MPCQCLCKYAKVICQLQGIEIRQSPVKADTLFSCTNLVLNAAEAQYRCVQCTHDSRVLIQLVTIIQTIFSWIKDQCQLPLDSGAKMKGSLGQHRLTEEELGFVKTALMSMTMGRIQRVIKVMVSRVEQMNVRSRRKDQSRGNMEADIKNLQHWIRALVQTSSELTKILGPRRP